MYSRLRSDKDTWPRVVRIRCWVHWMRNVLDKVPETARAEVKAHFVAVRDAPTPEVGRQTATAALALFMCPTPSPQRAKPLSVAILPRQ